MMQAKTWLYTNMSISWQNMLLSGVDHISQHNEHKFDIAHL